MVAITGTDDQIGPIVEAFFRLLEAGKEDHVHDRKVFLKAQRGSHNGSVVSYKNCISAVGIHAQRKLHPCSLLLSPE